MNRFDLHVKEALSDKYEVKGLLGKGGMANVYHAIQKGLDRDVAIKVIHPNLIHDPESVKRFRLEAKSAARLNHPNIITIYDVDEREDVVFICLEYLEGRDLADLLREKVRLRTDEIIGLLAPICSALAEIHDKSLIHRDIKSSNIFITKQGRPVLMDFGIAALRETSSGITLPGTVIGTPEYMSPEQARGETLGPQSDIYSLGIVMYQCLSGKVPFTGDSPFSTLVQISQGLIPELDRQALNVPEWLHEIVLKCLAKNPQDRFLTAQDLMESLQERKLITEREEALTKAIAVNYDKEIAGLKTLLLSASSLDEKYQVLENSSTTLKEVLKIDEELEVIAGAKKNKLAFDKRFDDHQGTVNRLKKLVIHENLTEDSIAEGLDLVKNLPTALARPDEISLIAVIELLAVFIRSNNTLSHEENAEHILHAITDSILALDNLYNYCDKIGLGEQELAKINKRLLGLYDDWCTQTMEIFKGEKLGRSERKQIYYCLNDLVELHVKTLPQKNDLLSLLTELHNKFLYPNSQLFQRNSPSPVSQEASNARPIDTPIASRFSFDEAFHQFVQDHLLANASVKSFLAMSPEALTQSNPSRLLYLMFSPRKNDNILSIIKDSMHILKHAFLDHKSLLDESVIVYNGQEINRKQLITTPALFTEEGTNDWDILLKSILVKLKEESRDPENVKSESAIIRYHFNLILNEIKPYVLKALLA